MIRLAILVLRALCIGHLSIGSSLAMRAPDMPPLPEVSISGHHTSDYTAKQNHPTSYVSSPSFKGPLKASKTIGYSSSEVSLRTRLAQYVAENDTNLPFLRKPFRSASVTSPPPLVASERPSTQMILNAILQQLVAHDAPIDAKEVMESTEFYLSLRKRIGAPLQIVDACAGHGLTGLLFAAGNPGLQRLHVNLVDAREPASFAVLRDLLTDVCPWIRDRVTYHAQPIQEYATSMRDKGTSRDRNAPTAVIGTHACGSLTDEVLRLATEALEAASVAVLPCCYTGMAKTVPYGVQRAHGVAWAADLRRSFWLAEQGYHVDFACIPSEITPMNRILIAEKRKMDKYTAQNKR